MIAYIIINTVMGHQLYLMDELGSLTSDPLQAKLFTDISTAKRYAKEYEQVFEVVVTIIREV